VSLLNIFWPTDPEYSPGCIGRLGRVLHWSFTAIGVVLLGVGFSVIDPVYLNSESLMAFGFSAASFVVGRIIRYVMAGE
jgi:hypothetical protein